MHGNVKISMFGAKKLVDFMFGIKKLVEYIFLCLVFMLGKI